MSKINRPVYNVGLTTPNDDKLYERVLYWWNTDFETIEDCDSDFNNMCTEYGLDDTMDMIEKVGVELGYLQND